MKKLSLLLGLLVAAGFAAEANAQITFSNPGALNLGANLSHQTGISGGVGQTVTAGQTAGAGVTHYGSNTIGQSATANNTGGGCRSAAAITSTSAAPAIRPPRRTACMPRPAAAPSAISSARPTWAVLSAVESAPRNIAALLRTSYS